MSKVEEARKILEENGYYVDALWHIDDVKHYLNEDDDESEFDMFEILDEVLANEWIIEQINYSIEDSIEYRRSLIKDNKDECDTKSE